MYIIQMRYWNEKKNEKPPFIHLETYKNYNETKFSFAMLTRSLQERRIFVYDIFIKSFLPVMKGYFCSIYCSWKEKLSTTIPLTLKWVCSTSWILYKVLLLYRHKLHGLKGKFLFSVTTVFCVNKN